MAEARKVTIGFRTRSQCTLYEAELKGQISDGAWENATPSGHWKIMCEAEAYVAESPAQLGLNFEPRRYYDFAASDLLEVVADRMIEFVKIYEVLYEKDPGYLKHWDFSFLGSKREALEAWERAQGEDSYWKGRVEKVCDLLQIGSQVELFEIVDRIAAVPYDMTSLRRDLSQMKKIMHLRQEGTYRHDIVKSGAVFAKCAPKLTAGKNRRPYVEFAKTLLCTGEFTKQQLIDSIREMHPSVSASAISTFLTDLKNPKYSVLPGANVIISPVGKWLLSFVNLP
jgi:hypothetical protein